MEIQAKHAVPSHPHHPLFHSTTIGHQWVAASAAAIHPHEDADEEDRKKKKKNSSVGHDQESFEIRGCDLIKEEELMGTGHEILRGSTQSSSSSSYSDNISNLHPTAAAPNVSAAAAFDPSPRPLTSPFVSRRRRREPAYPIRRCDRRVLKSVLGSLWSTFFPAEIDGPPPSSAGNTSTSGCSDGMASFRFEKEPVGACELESPEVASKTI